MAVELVDAGFTVPIPVSLRDASPQMISQGAEALVFTTVDGLIAKYRPAKPWRLAELDKKLRKRRTTQEARVLEKLSSAEVDVPKLKSVDTKLALIYMEYVKGRSLKQATWDCVGGSMDDVIPLYKQYGTAIAKMHSLNIVHGDLTTSNAMARDSTNSLCIIDFGLSSQAASTEDKAVDLYVLERAIQSTHPQEASLLMDQLVMPSYEAAGTALNDPRLDDVLQRLQKVRQRGRKRTQLG